MLNITPPKLDCNLIGQIGPKIAELPVGLDPRRLPIIATHFFGWRPVGDVVAQMVQDLTFRHKVRGATMRQYGVLARQLYDGLDAITGLPDIETMLKASNKKREVLTTKVPIAISWLNDFARAQSERNKADDEKRREVERLQGIQEETQSQDGAFDGSGGGQHGKAAASNDDQEPEK